MQQRLDAIAQVIISSAKNPNSRYSEEEIEKHAEAFFEIHFKENIQDAVIFLALEVPGINKKEACEAYTRFYEGMLELPAEQRGAVLQHFWTTM